MATLDQARLPRTLVEKIRTLARGDFLADAQNVLAFGLPGTGKSHAACAIGNALVEAATRAFRADLSARPGTPRRQARPRPPRALRKLDLYELIVLDDIGYVGQSADEAEVLFTLMAERYERRSMSSRPTSSSANGMHLQESDGDGCGNRSPRTPRRHSRIRRPSYRTEDAKKRRAKPDDNYPKSDDNYPGSDDNYPANQPQGPA